MLGYTEVERSVEIALLQIKGLKSFDFVHPCLFIVLYCSSLLIHEQRKGKCGFEQVFH